MQPCQYRGLAYGRGGRFPDVIMLLLSAIIGRKNMPDALPRPSNREAGVDYKDAAGPGRAARNRFGRVPRINHRQAILHRELRRASCKV